MKNRKFFTWAMLHSPDFYLCYFISPIEFRFYKFPGLYLMKITLQMPGFYVPWSVKDAYWRSLGIESEIDDLPF